MATPTELLQEIRELLVNIPERLAGASAAVGAGKPVEADWRTNPPDPRGPEREAQESPESLGGKKNPRAVERIALSGGKLGVGVMGEFGRGMRNVREMVESIQDFRSAGKTPPAPEPVTPKTPRTVEPDWAAMAPPVRERKPVPSPDVYQFMPDEPRLASDPVAQPMPKGEKPAREPGFPFSPERGRYYLGSEPPSAQPDLGSMLPEKESFGEKGTGWQDAVAELKKISGTLSPESTDQVSPLEGVAAEFDAIEGFPAASPSMNVSNRGGLRGAGGKALGSHAGAAIRKTTFLEPGGKAPV